jgi:trimeric autotransporter adhesin
VRSGTETVTLINSGEVPVVLDQVSFGGLDADRFALVGTPPSQVAAGGQATVDVSFAPAEAGEHTATLTVTHDGVNTPLEIALSGTGVVDLAPGELSAEPVALAFGEVPVGEVGTETVTLSNTGEQPVEVTGVSIDGSATFTVVTGFPFTVEPGAVADLEVEFNPPATGTFTATVSVEHDGLSSPLVIPLSGEGVSRTRTVRGVRRR